jgi:hypothetical protein
MARLGVAPHVADKILNHQEGTISGVAAVYQRHEFLAEGKEALDRWGAHVEDIVRTFGMLKPTILIDGKPLDRCTAKPLRTESVLARSQ